MSGICDPLFLAQKAQNCVVWSETNTCWLKLLLLRVVDVKDTLNTVLYCNMICSHIPCIFYYIHCYDTLCNVICYAILCYDNLYHNIT